MTPTTIFLCRANGEGSHEFRVAADEAGVMAFYKEMFGLDSDGKLDSAIEHFRDTDNWSNEGTAYHCELYCATFEVWKVEPRELAFVPTEVARTDPRNGPIPPEWDVPAVIEELDRWHHWCGNNQIYFGLRDTTYKAGRIIRHLFVRSPRGRISECIRPDCLDEGGRCNVECPGGPPRECLPQKEGSR